MKQNKHGLTGHPHRSLEVNFKRQHFKFFCYNLEQNQTPAATMAARRNNCERTAQRGTACSHYCAERCWMYYLIQVQTEFCNWFTVFFATKLFCLLN